MDRSETFKQLQELRRGRGIHAEDLDVRVGSLVRQACGVENTDSPAVVRHKVTLRLADLCGLLPDDLRLAVLAALALHEEASHRFLHERMAWLADCFDRDPRTVRRRMDAGFKLLAEQLDEAENKVYQPCNVYAPDGWYIESMRAVLRMDLDPPQLVEERRIVATLDELDEIVVCLSAPRKDIEITQGKHDQISAEMIFGGELVEERHPAGTHARFVVRLPQPLSLGQRHEYSIRFMSYPRNRMRPYYVLTPLWRCDQFTARVRFDDKHNPELVWRLHGVSPRALDDFTPNDDLITIDRLGDVVAEFHDLRQGLSYGIQWNPSSQHQKIVNPE